MSKDQLNALIKSPPCRKAQVAAVALATALVLGNLALRAVAPPLF